MLTFFRIIRTGILSFWRNRWLSLATVLILVISLSILTGLVLVSKATDSLVAEIRDKVDVSAYFLPETTEEDILAVKEDLNNFPDIAEVTYISREEALLKFRDAHSDNEVILQSLDEIGDNPLEASLNIKATQVSINETGNMWCVDEYNRAWRLVADIKEWRMMKEHIIQVHVGPNHVLMLGVDGCVTSWSAPTKLAPTGVWKVLPLKESLQYITQDNNKIWGITRQNKLYHE